MKSKQFLKEGFLEDAHEAHVDHEVQMARVDCYYAAEHAIVLHKLLRNISEEQGLEGWVASKITLANDYLKSVREHLEYQMMTADADEEDFLPIAEGITPVKKKSINESVDSAEEFERGPWYIILRGKPITAGGEVKRFNWLNGAKTFFRDMLDKNPELAEKIKSEYDEAGDKKSVIYYTKNLPSTDANSEPARKHDGISAVDAEKSIKETSKPGLWANIHAKRERIKRGSGERMRKPGSKGAPTDKDIKAIRAASNESYDLAESFKDEFMDFAKKFGQERGIAVGPRDAKPRPSTPGTADVSATQPVDRTALEARLKELQSRFDPSYEYSDDHAFWSEQNEIAKEIRSIKRTLAQQGVAEGAPELLKAEMPLVRHIERELADKGWQKSDDGYDKVFSSAMAMYRKFGNVDAIKKQGVAAGAGEQKYMAVYNKHIGNPSYIGKPITSDGKVIYVTASSKEEASSKFVEIFNRAQVLSSFIGRFDVVPKDESGEQGVAEGSEVQKTFKVVYHSPKTDRTVTKLIKASNESEIWDKLRRKDIQIISVSEQGVTESLSTNWKSWDPDNYEPESPEFYSSLSDAIISLVSERFGGKAWFDGGGYAFLIDASNPKKLVSSDGAAINVPNVARGLEKYTSNFKENIVDVYPSGWPDFFRSARKNPGPESDQEWYELGKMGIDVRENSRKLSKRGVAEGYKEPTDAAGHAKMAAKIKKMLDDTLADRGDRHGNPDPQRLTRAYEYHMEKAKEKQGVAEGFPYDVDHMPGPRKSLADVNKTSKYVVATNAIGDAKEHRVTVNATSKNNAMNLAFDHFEKKGLKPRIDFDGLRLISGVAEGLLDRFKKKTQQPEDPSYKKGWELCNKDPSADPIHLFRRHGEGLDRNQFMKGFNDNAESRGMKLRGDVSGVVDHATLRYKEFKRDRGLAEGIKDFNGPVEALIQVYNNRDQKIIKTKVFANEDEANRWADRNNAVILKLKDAPAKSSLGETSAGNVATVVNPTPKNRAKVGTLFGGTYKQPKARSKK